MRRLIVLCLSMMLVATVASACGVLTRLQLNSPAGEYIGQGKSLSYTPVDGSFLVTRNFDNGISVQFKSSTNNDYWYLDFASADRSPLVAGKYKGAERFGFQSAGCPGLSITGCGRDCNTLTGFFEVKRVVYDIDGSVLELWITFSQSYGGFQPALTGEVLINIAPALTPTISESFGALKARYR